MKYDLLYSYFRVVLFIVISNSQEKGGDEAFHVFRYIATNEWRARKKSEDSFVAYSSLITAFFCSNWRKLWISHSG